jgi:peptidyl-dipeptidase A
MEIYPSTEEAFNLFLQDFTPEIKKRLTDLRQASWDMETTGSKKASNHLKKCSEKFNALLSDKETYKKLVSWQNEGSLSNPEHIRILKLLINKFRLNQVPNELLDQISDQEIELSQAYIQFRTHFEGNNVGENDLLEVLKTELDVQRRKKAWDASKEIGKVLAPMIQRLVKLRNQKAHRLGFNDFYQMELEMQEIDKNWLFKFLSDFDEASKETYAEVYKDIEEKLAARFHVNPNSLGAWAWADPFCQEDPLSVADLDDLVKDIDVLKASKKFFSSLGFKDIDSIFERSDLFERESKNQHAFCTHIDGEGDIRILTNIRPTIRWLETVLHELGHAVYEQGYNPKISWILKTYPHLLTTEAIALIMGRCAYDPNFLEVICPKNQIEGGLKELTQSLRRRQLIFSRWVLVMVHFESSLYQNPEQDLNHLWWSLIQKYQKICPPSHHADKSDWACKYHIGLAPVYYHSYLLGEFFASMIKKHFSDESGSSSFYQNKNVSSFLNKKLFFPGNTKIWSDLVEHVVGSPLSYHDWIEDFKNP